MTETANQPGASAEVPPPIEATDGFEWAIVEVFGHRRHIGRIREEERFGAKMLRVDVPMIGADGRTAAWLTHWYGGSALFSVTHTDEATVLRANRPYEPAGRYLPAPERDSEFGDENTGGEE